MSGPLLRRVRRRLLSTRDDAEVAKFDRFRWGDTKGGGGAAPLHALNPHRVAFIADRTSVDGASVLDVGCGGGLLSRALAKRGAHVTGIDASSSAIAAAAAASSNDDVELIVGEAEHLEGREFDVVCALEVIEHVADAALFVRTLGRLAKRDVFLSTLDRTWLSWAVGVVAAEKIFGILPRGTHDWTKFLPPDEVAVMLGRAGLAVKDVAALHFVWGPLGLHRAWLGPFVPGLTPNYILHATKSNR